MNKTTTTMLMAAGLMFLAGCKTEVMRDRPLDPPQNDPVERSNAQSYRPMEGDNGAPAPIATPAPAPAPAPGFRPMEGGFNGDGVEEQAPRRRAPRGRRAAAPAAAGSVYIVKAGDTLGRIAYRHHVSVNALRKANNRTPDQDRFLRPGTKLVIPGGAVKAAPAGKKGTASAPRAGKKSPKLNADGTYTMVKGDSIPKVARMFGVRAKALQRANNLTDEETTRLQIGHKLVIPSGADAKVSAKKSSRVAPRKKAEAAKPEVVNSEAPKAPLPPDPAGDAAPAVPAAPVPPEAAPQAETNVMPPPAPVSADNAGTDFVSVAGCNTLEEFAAKNNTTVSEVLRLNPQIDRNAPVASHVMLYVPRAAK